MLCDAGGGGSALGPENSNEDPAQAFIFQDLDAALPLANEALDADEYLGKESVYDNGGSSGYFEWDVTKPYYTTALFIVGNQLVEKEKHKEPKSIGTISDLYIDGNSNHLVIVTDKGTHTLQLALHTGYINNKPNLRLSGYWCGKQSFLVVPPGSVETITPLLFNSPR